MRTITDVCFCFLLIHTPTGGLGLTQAEWLLVFGPVPSPGSHLIRISVSSGLAEFPLPSFASDKR